MKERNDEWTRLRRCWRDACDEYLTRVVEPGWDESRQRQSMARLALLSVKLRLFEQGRRSMKRATTKGEK